jgi:hypothetical protein
VANRKVMSQPAGRALWERVPFVTSTCPLALLNGKMKASKAIPGCQLRGAAAIGRVLFSHMDIYQLLLS